MPVDRLYTGTEPIPHPITGELIPLDDREALFKAWTAGENQIREHQTVIKVHSGASRQIRKACDDIVYALAGQAVARAAARDWASDMDQGC